MLESEVVKKMKPKIGEEKIYQGFSKVLTDDFKIKGVLKKRILRQTYCGKIEYWNTFEAIELDEKSKSLIGGERLYAIGYRQVKKNIKRDGIIKETKPWLHQSGQYSFFDTGDVWSWLLIEMAKKDEYFKNVILKKAASAFWKVEEEE